MRYLSLLVIPLGLALFAPARRHGRHAHAASSPAPARTSRVRPYAPLPFTPPPPAYDVPPRAAMVRPYVLHTGHRARLAEERRRQVDDQRLAVAVLMDLDRSAAPVPTPEETPPAGLALAGVS